jgi:translation initiation factor IF-2
MAKSTPQISNVPTKSGALKARPPIVVVVGHVDHGKTTLLDYIRKTTVAAREAGGITQAVGAYEIEHGGRKITFIDTPGHEAFMAMRSRGAAAADLAILVVAADEGVKPQTKESIRILTEAKTPFIVAFNKIDKATPAVLEKAKADVMSAGVMLEGYGGQVSYHGVSAKTGEGVSDLLDLILLTADVEDLKFDPFAPASGFVLEVRREPSRGIEATVIIKDGILKRGDLIKTHTANGKVKILEDFLEEMVTQLEPSAPAVIIGFESLPKVGEEFSVGVLKTKPGVAAPIAAKTGQQMPMSAAKKANTLNLILKASDGGSLEALSVVLRGVSEKESAQRNKRINIVEESVGDITDGDVKHALATGSTIIGFKNKVEKGAQMLGEAQSVTIITSKIVYDLLKAVEDFLTGAAGPVAAGELEVLAVFNQEKPEKQLVGGRVLTGLFRGKASFEILRRDESGEQIKEPAGHGRVLELREKKAEIAQAEKGKEIGVLVNSQVLVKVGDKLVIKK